MRSSVVMLAMGESDSDIGSMLVVVSGCGVGARVTSVVSFCSVGRIGLSRRKFESTGASLMHE